MTSEHDNGAHVAAFENDAGNHGLSSPGDQVDKQRGCGMRTIDTAQVKTFTAAQMTLWYAILGAAFENEITSFRFGIEPVTVTVIPDTQPAPSAMRDLPEQWIERAAAHYKPNMINTTDELARSDWYLLRDFIDALVYSLRLTTGNPEMIVTAPDFVIYVKYSPID